MNLPGIVYSKAGAETRHCTARGTRKLDTGQQVDSTVTTSGSWDSWAMTESGATSRSKTPENDRLRTEFAPTPSFSYDVTPTNCCDLRVTDYFCGFGREYQPGCEYSVDASYSERLVYPKPSEYMGSSPEYTYTAANAESVNYNTYHAEPRSYNRVDPDYTARIMSAAKAPDYAVESDYSSPGSTYSIYSFASTQDQGSFEMARETDAIHNKVVASRRMSNTVAEDIKNIHAKAGSAGYCVVYDAQENYYQSYGSDHTIQHPQYAWSEDARNRAELPKEDYAVTIQNIIAGILAKKETESWMLDVWRDDVSSAFNKIANIIDQYNYVAIDTEFPGKVMQHGDPKLTKSSLNYLDLRDNVNSLSVIQLGLTFTDKDGNKPPVSTFQFNFRFDLRTERHDPKSIQMLQEAGVDFNRHIAEGIDIRTFAEHMIASGLVLNDNIRWICFHGMYDFGYLSRVLSQTPLPDTPTSFFEQLYLYFPVLTDIKYILRSSFSGGLKALAVAAAVTRCGEGHTGGSDARLTSDVFFKIVSEADREKVFSGSLFGLEPEEFVGRDKWNWDLYDDRLALIYDEPMIPDHEIKYEGWYDMNGCPQLMY